MTFQDWMSEFRVFPLPAGEGGAKRRVRVGRPSSGPSGHLLPKGEGLAEHKSPLTPQIPLQDGEQYRFHFDMSKCIGCKCCEVACAEQNGNPASINWRRVGEIEGGWFPATKRSYLSMGCNHCVEPTCLKGCPVDAY